MPTFPSTPGYIVPAKANEAETDPDVNVDVDVDVDADELDTNSTNTNEPTFPDIVILKQTEHNYIVKHNHYPVQSSDDLVSPNQIHKGQISKKRGRKPKAGFILNAKNGLYDCAEVPNIILHLKCHVTDLKTNDSISNYDYVPCVNEVESYTAHSAYLQSSDINVKKMSDTDDSDDDEHAQMGHNRCGLSVKTSIHAIGGAVNTTASATGGATINVSVPAPVPVPMSVSVSVPAPAPLSVLGGANANVAMSANSLHTNIVESGILNERAQREIMKKIQRLKHSFHNGETIQTKTNNKSSCFWDTCEFDGPVYYIPIMIVNGIFQVSGCYCSPQCALAALLKESLDTSTKFERMHLLQLLYGSPNGNNKAFKPAPNPHYLLDKYYGNLTIQEYRALAKGSAMIHIVNKPLTHILPELYEDNNDFMVNSKVIPTNSLKMKKKYKTMVVQSGAE